MIITDILVKSDDGHVGNATCETPEQLLNIMETEQVEECKVTLTFFGDNTFTTKVKRADVVKMMNKR